MFEEIDLVRLRREGRDEPVCDGANVVRQHRQGARCEGGCDGAALDLPILALGEEQAATHDWVKEAYRRHGAAVVLSIVD